MQQLFGMGPRRRHRDGGSADGTPSAAELVAPGREARTDDIVRLLDIRRWHNLRFPAELELQFEADQYAGRRMLLFVVAVIGTLVYASFAITDPLIMPDVAAVCWRMRLILTPLMALAAAAMWLRLRPWMRETLLACNTLLVSLSTGYLVAHSHSPAALNHATSMLLPPMFAGIAARLRFRYTLVVGLGTLAAFVCFIRPHSSGGALIVRDDVMIVGSAILFSLIANYSLEYRERSAYLLNLLQRRRSESLEQANTALQRLALLDPLTGVQNRRGFEQQLDFHWRRCAAAGSPLSLLIVDVDFFKLYNDSYGHPAGDECLRRVAAVLGGTAARLQGLAARIGGEEFAVLLPDRQAAAASAIAESICAAVRELDIPHRLSRVAGRVTVSVGCAEVEPAVETRRTSLMELADHALYSAKMAGRNRSAVAAAQKSAEPMLNASAA